MSSSRPKSYGNNMYESKSFPMTSGLSHKQPAVSQLMRSLSWVCGPIYCYFASFGGVSLLCVAELLLAVQEGSDLNLPVEPKRTCYNLWAISVLPFIFRPALPVLLVLLPAADLRPAQRGLFTLNRIKAGKMGVHSSLPTKAVITVPDPTPAISRLNFIFLFFLRKRKMESIWVPVWQSSRGHSDILLQGTRMEELGRIRGSADGLLAFYVNPWNMWGNVAGNVLA